MSEALEDKSEGVGVDGKGEFIPTLSQREATDYIVSLAMELKAIAKKARLPFQVYLLDMVIRSPEDQRH